LETGNKFRLWILYPGSNAWIVVAIDPPPMPPILIESIAMLLAAILLSLGAAWQMQRPLSRVAQVARRFGKGERPLLVAERGPREVRDLIQAVNQMMTRISQSEDEKALMLAGIAHDLKAPLTRMKLRASALEDERDRDHFSRDVDSLTHIVRQFLEFAGSEPSDGPDVPVERFLAEQFAALGSGDEALFIHRFEAGPGFVLPRTLIDRLVTNVVDNALEHGEPPVEMATYARGGNWILEIRDHGQGIPEDRIEEACKPFARLDSARSGNGHCGLGLAIVARLARKQRGSVEIGNAPGGGLYVRIVLPNE
jgi:two-component system osmolarity sensor histidine kinase EnvZ